MIKPSPEASDTSWHLDKRVPITLLLAIGLQTAGAVWWASGISERVSTLERGDQGRAAQATQLNDIAVDIAVLKENVKTTKDDISSMKNGFEMLMQQMLQEKTRR